MDIIQRHLPSPLPYSLVPDVLDLDQWTTLAAIVDTYVSPVVDGHDGSDLDVTASAKSEYDTALRELENLTSGDRQGDQLCRDYLAERASSIPGYKEAFQRYIKHHTDSKQKADLVFVLKALNTRTGSLLLTGTSATFPELNVKQRGQIISSWKNAYLPLFRTLHKTFASLATLYWLRLSPTYGKILSYPKIPIEHNFGEAFPFKFLQIPPDSGSKDDVETLQCDVVIVGSGSSASVTASVLSRAGLSVIVTDKSYYWRPEHLPMSEADAANHLFSGGGVHISEDSSTSILAGSCWGGGGTVNWSASLQLQAHVRQMWAEASGVSYFTSSAFQNDMDAVCETMGVSTSQIKHNFANTQLLEGARRLGMNAKAVPQNTGGQTHSCGYCTLGCGNCGKKGPTESWLPDAARHGARFIEGFHCHSVIYSDKPSSSGNRKAIGVQGVWTSRDSNAGMSGSDRYKRSVHILAKCAVVSACGALETPMLLRRSGITSPHVGSHLHLHPCSMLGAIYDHDVLPWNGSILTSVVNDFENINASGYGVKLEATTMIPGMFLPVFEWKSSLQWKLFAAKMRRATGYISLARDVSEGKIFPDPGDEMTLKVQYTPNKLDRRHIAYGLEALAKVVFIGGAREIFVSVPGIPPFVRQGEIPKPEADEIGVNDPAFQEWLGHIRKLKIYGHNSDAPFGSAHQMGTARMGSTSANSAVDPKGRVWDVDGLYVVDTSVFPGSSGVNPMITCMATARGIARGMAKEYGGQDKEVVPRL